MVTAREDRDGWSEFSGTRLLILSVFFGLTTSLNAVMVYSLGSFIGPLNAEFGWDRGSISLAALVLTIGIFVFGPWVGLLCDRFGAATVGALSLLGYGAGVIVMTLVIDSVYDFWLAFFLIAILGVGSTPIALVRPITAMFDKRRGLALGIVLTGAGLAGFWVPIVVTEVSAVHGWRAGYWTIGGLAMLVAPLVWFGIGRSERRSRGVAKTDVQQSGMTLAEARRTGGFWLTTLLALTLAMGIGGMIVHLIPLFQDMGADAKTAARIASILGIASSVGRLAIGMCLDRYTAPLVSVAAIALGMAGILILGTGGLGYAIVGVALIGVLLGAELDLLAYLASRLFGQKSFGAIYGWFYGVYSIGFGLSPFLIGQSRDMFGSYDAALITSGLLLTVAVGAVWGLSSAKTNSPAPA